MGRTKAQISRAKYKCGLSDLTAGEKATITKMWKKENLETTSTPTRRTSGSGMVSVAFGRPGVNGLKTLLAHKGTKMEDALAQSGLKINKKKEGVIAKNEVGSYSAGQVVMFNDEVVDGAVYAIVPGVDSSN